MGNKDAETNEALLQEVKTLEERVASLKPVTITFAPKSDNANAQGEDVTSKLGELNGRIDELQHHLDVLHADLEQQKADKTAFEALEKRLSELEKKESQPSPVPPALAEVAISEPTNDGEEEEGSKLHIVRHSFAERMLSVSPETSHNYNAIKNHLLSYRSLNSRISFPCDSYRGHRKLYAKIVLCQKTLKLYLALSLKDYHDSAIPLEDASDKKISKEVPCLLRVKSSLSLRRAYKLIDEMLLKAGFVQKKGESVLQDYVSPVKEEGRRQAAKREKASSSSSSQPGAMAK